MQPEVLLVLFLVSHSMDHGIVRALSIASCTDAMVVESFLSATCHWDGRMDVNWGSHDGIQVLYNCTGETEQQGLVFGWSFDRRVRSKTIIIEDWNYYNSTCYVYGCYDDLDFGSKHLLPSTACTVLTPPIQLTSTFLPSFVVQTAVNLYEDYENFRSIEPSSQSAGSGFSPLFTSSVFSDSITEEPFSSTLSHSSPRQTPLLAAVATVAVFMVVCLSLIFIVLFVGAGARQWNQHRNYNLHKDPYHEKEENNVESEIFRDRISHRTDSEESIFNKFVKNDGDVLKVTTMVTGTSNSIMEPDTVSECKTVHMEGDAEEGEAENEIDDDDNDESIQKHEMDESHLDDARTHVVQATMNYNFIHPSFHPMRSKGYASASTSGQTSEYMYTSYSSDANTISTSNMEYELFPEDSAPACDEVFEYDELDKMDPQGQDSLSINSPAFNRDCLRPGPETTSSPMQDSDNEVSEHCTKASFLQRNFLLQHGDSTGAQLEDESADGYVSSGLDEDFVEGGARGVTIHGITGSNVDKSYIGRGELEQDKERDIQDDHRSS